MLANAGFDLNKVKAVTSSLGPAITGVEAVLATLATQFGYAGTTYRQAVNMALSNATAWFATIAMRLYRLWRPFREVQQDLLLSCFTIGQACCVLEIFQ